MSSLNLDLIPADQAQPAPRWSVERWLNVDEPPSLETLRGRVVVLHAFQMLCPGCVSHGIPQAQRIHALFSTADVCVLGLHTVFEHHHAMRPVSLRAFLHEYRISFPVGIDEARVGTPMPKTMGAYGMRGTPSLILIDTLGRLRVHAFGRPEDLVLGAAISTLLAERDPRVRAETPSEPAAATVGPSCDDDGCAVPRATGV